MSAPARHPDWCLPERCTIDVQPVSGLHRSAVEQADGTGLRVKADLTKTERGWDTKTFVNVEVDSALNGLAQFGMTAGEARSLGLFLIRLAARADDADRVHREVS